MKYLLGFTLDSDDFSTLDTDKDGSLTTQEFKPLSDNTRDAVAYGIHHTQWDAGITEAGKCSFVHSSSNIINPVTNVPFRGRHC